MAAVVGRVKGWRWSCVWLPKRRRCFSISTPEALLDDATFMRKLQVRSVAVSFGDCPAPVVLDYTLGYDLDDPSRHISDSMLVVYLQHDGALCAVTTES